jgi:hypothetical protein
MAPDPLAEKPSISPRRLLPAANTPLSARQPSGLSRRQSKRVQNVAAACEACRKRKSKVRHPPPPSASRRESPLTGRRRKQCTGQRPSCSACVTRRTPCSYTTFSSETHSQALKRKYGELLRAQDSAYRELFHVLRSKSEAEAIGLLRRIRLDGDVEAVLRHVRDGDLLMQVAFMPDGQRLGACNACGMRVNQASSVGRPSSVA